MEDQPSPSEASASRHIVPGIGESIDKKQRPRIKKQVCEEVIRRLQEQQHPYVQQHANYAEALLAHFMRLPTRYAQDVNTERAEDVLTHMQMLEDARRTGPQGVPVIHVRAVRLTSMPAQSMGHHGMETDDFQQQHPAVGESQLAPPAFGSTTNLEAPAAHPGPGGPSAMEEDIRTGSSAASGVKGMTSTSSMGGGLHLHEITFSTVDKPKLLSQLSAFLADAGLNIREAHVFSTSDSLSLDVFVVDGWLEQDAAQLQEVLEKALQSGGLEGRADAPLPPAVAGAVAEAALSHSFRSPVPIPTDGKDDWEIDSTQLKLHHKIASGSFGDLFRGTYCGQDVAIKILKTERLNDSLQQEFAQEVFIMRKVRHKNVVQFIGACTKPPNLSIVTEFMSGGSVFDYLHKHKGSMKPPMLVRVALDVAKGMDFLHKNNIIHRDLKAANLLMDENEVVKVADFGVARIQASSGIMTAETGTYRWMAPEVIEHRAYDHKADVFSYAITLWELLTGKIPYSDLTPLQAAVSVVQKGLRPPMPKGTHLKLTELLNCCWHVDPAQRPEFSHIITALADLLQEVEDDSRADGKRREKRGGFFSALKR